MSATNQLPIPGETRKDPDSFEFLRVWVANGSQHVSIRLVWSDPASWGVALADLAKHVARAYQQDDGREPGTTIERILAGLHAELESPTDEPSGGVL
jgi:hypothetical protein